MWSTPQPTRQEAARSHETIHRFRVERADVGLDGFVTGGKLLEWIDKAGGAVAAQWSGRDCVIASVGNIHLDRPIGVGELVDVHASLVYTGRSSMHILIGICSFDPSRVDGVQTSQCAVIFVASDDTGGPVEVPKWTPVTMLELQRQRQARVRIPMRKRIEGAMDTQSYTGEGTALRVTASFPVGPTDADRGGKVQGGRVMRWIDQTANACGAEWTGDQVITSYVAGIRFYRPVVAGDTVDVTARIIHTRPRSIHISVHVSTADADGGQRRLVAQAVTVVVSLNACGEARAVRQWATLSDEGRRLDGHARHLIALRQFHEPFTTAVAIPAHTESAPVHNHAIAS
jgi:4-hydroxybenzoyl-CoA thioesterase